MLTVSGTMFASLVLAKQLQFTWKLKPFTSGRKLDCKDDRLLVS